MNQPWKHHSHGISGVTWRIATRKTAIILLLSQKHKSNNGSRRYFCVGLFITSTASWWASSVNYRAQRSCGQGNIFTPVCHSFCSQGGVCLSACWDTTPPNQIPTPPDQTPPPRADTPPDQTPTPGSRHPPGSRHTPPKEQTHPRGSRLQHTVYERPVRILLECILVWSILLCISSGAMFILWLLWCHNVRLCMALN